MLVVGAGPSGLSAACHLTRLGYAVTIKDAGAEPGGLCLAFWLIGVFVAAREPRRRESGAGTASLPQQPTDMDKPVRKAA